MSSPRKRVGMKRLKTTRTQTKVKRVRLSTPSKKSQRMQRLEASDADDDDAIADEDVEINWQKLEEELERNAARANLTTVNVKSILHHILSDERVIALAKRADKDNKGKSIDEIVSETKLTRAKARALGYQPLPLSVEEEPKATILDVTFSESSSSDEEYNPLEDEEDTYQQSDEELSTFSDFPSETHSLNTSFQGRSRRLSMSDAISESDGSYIVTPEKTKQECSYDASREISTVKGEGIFAIPDLPNLSATKCDEDLIASRTRSRLPMPDIEVEEIAALFEPPDTEKLDVINFENIDDPDEITWKSWLLDLAKPMKALNDTGDDPNDKDFNYMDEVLDEDTELENEEFRNDKATRITQKELQELFNELLLGYNEQEYTYYDNIVKEDTQKIRVTEKVKPSSSSPSAVQEEEDHSLNITLDQRQHIIAQLQQHVQLLTQIYMTTCTIQDLKETSSQCKQYIEELYNFQNKALENSASGGGHLQAELSTFCTPGISDSYRIIKSLQGKTIRACASNKKKWLKWPINDTIIDMFSCDPYFATYPELLPDQGMNEDTQVRISRITYSQCEDNLLALGLEQFKGKDKFEQIRDHLLPTRTSKQLMIRTKNLSSRRNNSNPVALFKMGKALPELKAKVKIVTPRDISTLPLIKLPRTIWKGREIPSWYLKSSKKLQLDKEAFNRESGSEGDTDTHITYPASSSKMYNHTPSPCASTNTNTQVNYPAATPNVYVAKQPASNTFYTTPSPEVSRVCVHANTGHQSAPVAPMVAAPSNTFYTTPSPEASRVCCQASTRHQSAPVAPMVMIPPPVVYQPVPGITQPIVGGYAMVPMMYCPVVPGMVAPSVPGVVNYSTSKSVVHPQICMSQSVQNVKLLSSGKVFTPMLQRTANIKAVNNVKKVKRALKYSHKKKKKNENNNIENTPIEHELPSQDSQSNVESQPTNYNLQTIAESICNTQSPGKGLFTPVKSYNELNSMDGFNIPFLTLIKDLPSPSSIPYLKFTPEKPLRETSLPDVKQVLVTPKKERTISTKHKTKCKSSSKHNYGGEDVTSIESDVCVQDNNDTFISTSLGSLESNSSVAIATSTSISTVETVSHVPTSSIDHSKLTAIHSEGVISVTTVVASTYTNVLSHNTNSFINLCHTTNKEGPSSLMSNKFVTNTNTLPESASIQTCSEIRDEDDVSTSNANSLEPVTSVPVSALSIIPISKPEVCANESFIEVGSLMSENSISVTRTVANSLPVNTNVISGAPVLSLTLSSTESVVVTEHSSITKDPSSMCQNGVSKVFPNSYCSDNLETNNLGDDESTYGSDGMDGDNSQTEDEISECPEDIARKNLKDAALNRKELPENMNKKKIKTHKKPLKVKKKSDQRKKKRSKFNRSEKMQQKVQDFALLYLQGVKTTLSGDKELFDKFCTLMQEGSAQKLTKLETYFKVADLFCDYPVLVDNFAGFLDQHEARHVGKFMHWLTYHQILNFHLSCEQHFFNRPGWYKKIVQKILDVTEMETNSEKIVEAVTPLFCGNQNLANQFRKLFPDLPPPSCSGDEFEVIDFDAVTSGRKEFDDFEEIQYQPPESDSQLNEFSKRNIKTRARDKKDSSKFSKRKSNRDITASKLRDLANKRKKNKAHAQSSMSDTTDINSDVNNTADEEATNTADEDTTDKMEDNYEKSKRKTDKLFPSDGNINDNSEGISEPTSNCAHVSAALVSDVSVVLHDIINVQAYDVACSVSENIVQSNQTLPKCIILPNVQNNGIISTVNVPTTLSSHMYSTLYQEPSKSLRITDNFQEGIVASVSTEECLVRNNNFQKGLGTCNDLQNQLLTSKNTPETLVTSSSSQGSLVTNNHYVRSLATSVNYQRSPVTSNNYQGSIVTNNKCHEDLVSSIDLQKNVVTSKSSEEDLITINNPNEDLVTKSLKNLVTSDQVNPVHEARSTVMMTVVKAEFLSVLASSDTLPSISKATTKKPLSYSIIPFKDIRSCESISFLELSNSQFEIYDLVTKAKSDNVKDAPVSGDSSLLTAMVCDESGEKSVIHPRYEDKVADSSKRESSLKVGTKEPGQSTIFPNIIGFRNKKQNKPSALQANLKNASTVTTNDDRIQDSVPVTSTENVKQPILINREDKVKENLFPKSCNTIPKPTEIEGMEINEHVTQDKLLNKTEDKDSFKTPPNPKHSSPEGTLNVEEDLTFQDHTILTNHLASNDGTSLPVSNLSFGSMLAEVISISSVENCNESSVSNHLRSSKASLMGPPPQVSINSNSMSLSNMQERNLSNSKQLSLSDHPISTKVITPSSGNKSSNSLSFSGRITPIPTSVTQECLPVNTVSNHSQANVSENSHIMAIPACRSLTFSGKIIPMPTGTPKKHEEETCEQVESYRNSSISNKQVFDKRSLENSMDTSEVVSFGKSPLYTCALNTAAETTMSTTNENSRSICSQQSVDIDFKVSHKINETIEISCDTLLCSKDEKQMIEIQADTVMAEDDTEKCSHNGNQLIKLPPVTCDEALSLIGEISSSSSASADMEVAQITSKVVKKSTPIHETYSPAVDIDVLHSNDAQFNINFNDNSNKHGSVQQAMINAVETKGVGKCDVSVCDKDNRQPSRDLSSSPKIMMASTKFSNETVVTNSGASKAYLRNSKVKRGGPRRLSRSEIITLDENTSFQDDSSSSFEDNYNYSSFAYREKSMKGNEGSIGELESLPFKKVEVAEFSNTKQKKIGSGTMEVLQPIPSPITAVQNFNEDSQQSNRSFSCDYISSPQTPLFVSNYVELKTDNADITPNNSFNVVDRITENLVLSDANSRSIQCVEKAALEKCNQVATDLKATVENSYSNTEARIEAHIAEDNNSSNTEARIEAHITEDNSLGADNEDSDTSEKGRPSKKNTEGEEEISNKIKNKSKKKITLQKKGKSRKITKRRSKENVTTDKPKKPSSLRKKYPTRSKSGIEDGKKKCLDIDTKTLENDISENIKTFDNSVEDIGMAKGASRLNESPKEVKSEMKKQTLQSTCDIICPKMVTVSCTSVKEKCASSESNIGSMTDMKNSTCTEVNVLGHLEADISPKYDNSEIICNTSTENYVFEDDNKTVNKEDSSKTVPHAKSVPHYTTTEIGSLSKKDDSTLKEVHIPNVLIRESNLDICSDKDTHTKSTKRRSSRKDKRSNSFSNTDISSKKCMSKDSSAVMKSVNSSNTDITSIDMSREGKDHDSSSSESISSNRKVRSGSSSTSDSKSPLDNDTKTNIEAKNNMVSSVKERSSSIVDSNTIITSAEYSKDENTEDSLKSDTAIATHISLESSVPGLHKDYLTIKDDSSKSCLPMKIISPGSTSKVPSFLSIADWSRIQEACKAILPNNVSSVNISSNTDNNKSSKEIEPLREDKQSSNGDISKDLKKASVKDVKCIDYPSKTNGTSKRDIDASKGNFNGSCKENSISEKQETSSSSLSIKTPLRACLVNADVTSKCDLKEIPSRIEEKCNTSSKNSDSKRLLNNNNDGKKDVDTEKVYPFRSTEINSRSEDELTGKEGHCESKKRPATFRIPKISSKSKIKTEQSSTSKDLSDNYKTEKNHKAVLLKDERDINTLEMDIHKKSSGKRKSLRRDLHLSSSSDSNFSTKDSFNTTSPTNIKSCNFSKIDVSSRENLKMKISPTMRSNSSTKSSSSTMVFSAVKLNMTDNSMKTEIDPKKELKGIAYTSNDGTKCDIDPNSHLKTSLYEKSRRISDSSSKTCKSKGDPGTYLVEKGRRHSHGSKTAIVSKGNVHTPSFENDRKFSNICKTGSVSKHDPRIKSRDDASRSDTVSKHDVHTSSFESNSRHRDNSKTNVNYKRGVDIKVPISDKGPSKRDVEYKQLRDSNENSKYDTDAMIHQREWNFEKSSAHRNMKKAADPSKQNVSSKTDINTSLTRKEKVCDYSADVASTSNCNTRRRSHRKQKGDDYSSKVDISSNSNIKMILSKKDTTADIPSNTGKSNSRYRIPFKKEKVNSSESGISSGYDTLASSCRKGNTDEYSPDANIYSKSNKKTNLYKKETGYNSSGTDVSSKDNTKTSFCSRDKVDDYPSDTSIYSKYNTKTNLYGKENDYNSSETDIYSRHNTTSKSSRKRHRSLGDSSEKTDDMKHDLEACYSRKKKRKNEENNYKAGNASMCNLKTSKNISNNISNADISVNLNLRTNHSRENIDYNRTFKIDMTSTKHKYDSRAAKPSILTKLDPNISSYESDISMNSKSQLTMSSGKIENRTKIDVKTYISRSVNPCNTDVQEDHPRCTEFYNNSSDKDCISKMSKHSLISDLDLSKTNTESSTYNEESEGSDDTCEYNGSPKDPRIKHIDTNKESLEFSILNWSDSEPKSSLNASVQSISNNVTSSTVEKCSSNWLPPPSQIPVTSNANNESADSVKSSTSNYSNSNSSLPPPQVPVVSSHTIKKTVDTNAIYLNDDYWSAPSPQIPLISSKLTMESPAYMPDDDDSISPTDDNFPDCSTSELRQSPIKVVQGEQSLDSEGFLKWTQSEDQDIVTILIQHQGDEEKACTLLNKKLLNRSLTEIRKRTDFLMNHISGDASGDEDDDGDSEDEDEESD